MKEGKVYNNEMLAGFIQKLDDGSYRFMYDEGYYANPELPAISLTLPKTKRVHSSAILFPFFFNLLSEGSNKKLQSRILKIDEEDHFEFLLKTTAHETIGAIRVEEITEDADNN
jgi:serine/threonine-protein kinase HipA